jgi:hypothetical protein
MRVFGVHSGGKLKLKSGENTKYKYETKQIRISRIENSKPKKAKGKGNGWPSAPGLGAEPNARQRLFRHRAVDGRVYISRPRGAAIGRFIENRRSRYQMRRQHGHKARKVIWSTATV